MMVTADGQAFVDGAWTHGGAIHGEDGMRRVNVSVPPADGAVLGGEDERGWTGFPGLRDQEPGRSIEHDARRRRSDRRARRRRDRHDERGALARKWLSVAPEN